MKLPISDFTWLTEEEISKFDILKTDLDGDIGYIIECDLHYPKKLHNKHSNLPLAPEVIEISYENLSPYAKKALLDSDDQKKYKDVKLTSTLHDRIDYVAAEPGRLLAELTKLFEDIEYLLSEELSNSEVLYFASYIHLAFVMIHPFQDGNGRSARLIEKWFLIEKLGDKATAIQLEKNYYLNLQDYYKNLKRLGVDYELLDFGKASDFLMMTAEGLLSQK
jgi:hypothetical protein